MAGETLTLEVYHGGRWHAAAELKLFEPDKGAMSGTQLGYAGDYVDLWVEDLETRDQRAIAERYPVGFGVWTAAGWPAFVYDIVPSGAARRWWRDQLAASFETEAQLDWLLLRHHTVAPIGHLRVAVDAEPRAILGFSKADVLTRDIGFLEYAAARGAAIGGATGAGGDAPKVLLAEDGKGNIYPAGTLTDEETISCWFVKWPRGRDTSIDRVVLETEHYYARALDELGLDVCAGALERDGEIKPSLWLPRFDRRVTEQGLERVAVESLYSLAGVTTMGASMRHQQYLRALQQALLERGQLEDFPELVREYVRRDLLDVVLGNSDNHGRNRALIRGARLQWAPIYDLAPMVLDPAGIRRSTTWEVHEYAGAIDWQGVCRELDEWIDGLELTSCLREFAAELLVLPEMLQDFGVADAVMTAPRIYLADLVSTLDRWGLR